MSADDYVVAPTYGLDGHEVDQLHLLVNTLVKEGAALGWVEPPTREDVSRMARRLTTRSADDDARLVLARRTGGDREIVGFAYWSRREMETEAVHADIVRVAVSSGARGGGLGKRLVQVMIDEAREIGIEVLTLDVRGNNHAAMQLYEAMGFTEYGRIADFVAIGDERWDNLYYALDLRPDDHDLTLHGDAPRGAGASERRD